METTGYPRLVRRIQGAFIDGLVIPLTAITILIILVYLGIENPLIKIFAVVFSIFLLEPVILSFTGGTIGHHLVGIRVRRIHSDEHLHLGLALVRFIIKTLFGLPSFLIILVTRRRQALHDLVAQSLVVYKDTIGLPDHAMLQELTRSDENRAYVSIWRRILIICLYWLICFIAWSIVVTLFVSNQCTEGNVCTEGESYWVLSMFVFLLLMLIVFAVIGWRGKLYGCRKL